MYHGILNCVVAGCRKAVAEDEAHLNTRNTCGVRLLWKDYQLVRKNLNAQAVVQAASQLPTTDHLATHDSWK